MGVTLLSRPWSWYGGSSSGWLSSRWIFSMFNESIKPYNGLIFLTVYESAQVGRLVPSCCQICLKSLSSLLFVLSHLPSWCCFVRDRRNETRRCHQYSDRWRINNEWLTYCIWLSAYSSTECLTSECLSGVTLLSRPLACSSHGGSFSGSLSLGMDMKHDQQIFPVLLLTQLYYRLRFWAGWMARPIMLSNLSKNPFFLAFCGFRPRFLLGPALRSSWRDSSLWLWLGIVNDWKNTNIHHVAIISILKRGSVIWVPIRGHAPTTTMFMVRSVVRISRFHQVTIKRYLMW